MSIKQKFLIMIAVIFTFIFSASIVLVITNNFLVEKSTDIADRQINVINKAHELKLSVIQVQQWLTDISATRGLHGLDSGFKEAEYNAKRFESLIQELGQLDHQMKERYQDMLPAFKAYYSVGKKMAHAYVESGPDAGNKMMTEFDTVAENISSVVNKLLLDIQKRVDIVVQEQKHASRIAHSVFLASSIIVIILLLIFSYIMLRSLAKLPDE